MKVRELMQYLVSTVKPDSNVKDVMVELFVERKDTILIARDELLKKCEGIVTKSDIYIKVLAPNLDPSGIKISEVVKPSNLITISPITISPITISPDASCKEAAEIMISNNIRRVPVVENEVLVGIITSEDLLQCVG